VTRVQGHKVKSQ